MPPRRVCGWLCGAAIAATRSSPTRPKWLRYGAEMTLPDSRERLVSSQCGSRNIDVVVTGTARRIQK
jgi:hypothetical protein